MTILADYLAWATLAVTCSSMPTALVSWDGDTPLSPSQDPFYTAPVGYEATAPGTILRIRSAPGNLTTITGNCSATHQIVYRTTDSRYEPSWAVTTLLTPSSPSGNGTALLSYQIATDSADVDANPSYALYNDTGNSFDIATALGKGCLGLDGNTRYAMWGYSGGSLACEWAAELQLQYAPELNFSGVALGGLVPNVSSIFQTVTGTVLAGLVPPSLLGSVSQYPEARDYLINNLKTSGSYNKTTFLSAYHLDGSESLTAFANQNIFEYFEDGIATLHTPLLERITNNNGYMGYHGIPQMPLFIYKAVHDELSPVNDTDLLVQRYCQVGVNILYQRNTIGGHIAEITNGDGRAFEWLSGVLDGTPRLNTPSVGCFIENVAVNITDSSF